MCSAHQSSESAAGDEDSNDRSTAERSPALERTVLVNTKTRTLPTSAPQNKFPIGRIRRLRTFFSLDRDAQYRTWYRPASTARTKQSHVDKAIGSIRKKECAFVDIGLAERMSALFVATQPNSDTAISTFLLYLHRVTRR